MDAGTRAIGVASAIVLVITLLWQLRAQWKKGTSEGVSRFLFVGQLAASTGFAIYSAMIGDPVFVATNITLGIAGSETCASLVRPSCAPSFISCWPEVSIACRGGWRRCACGRQPSAEACGRSRAR